MGALIASRSDWVDRYAQKLDLMMSTKVQLGSRTTARRLKRILLMIDINEYCVFTWSLLKVHRHDESPK